MRIRIWVNKQRNQGTDEFFGAFRALVKDAKTWRVKSADLKSVTIESTATISSLPCKPRWLFIEHDVGRAEIECLNDELSPAQQAHALGDLVYLCLTALGSFVAKIEISCQLIHRDDG